MGTQFSLRIGCSNRCFTFNGEKEIARILRDLAKTLEEGERPYEGSNGKLWDANGNVVGGWSITKK